MGMRISNRTGYTMEKMGGVAGKSHKKGGGTEFLIHKIFQSTLITVVEHDNVN